MGISPQIVRIPTQIKNDKDLTQTQKVQDFNSNKKSQFPDYVKPLLKQYICLLRFNQDFGNLIKDLDYDNVKEVLHALQMGVVMCVEDKAVKALS